MKYRNTDVTKWMGCVLGLWAIGALGFGCAKDPVKAPPSIFTPDAGAKDAGPGDPPDEGKPEVIAGDLPEGVAPSDAAITDDPKYGACTGQLLAVPVGAKQVQGKAGMVVRGRASVKCTLPDASFDVYRQDPSGTWKRVGGVVRMDAFDREAVLECVAEAGRTRFAELLDKYEQSVGDEDNPERFEQARGLLEAVAAAWSQDDEACLMAELGAGFVDDSVPAVRARYLLAQNSAAAPAGFDSIALAEVDVELVDVPPVPPVQNVEAVAASFEYTKTGNPIGGDMTRADDAGEVLPTPPGADPGRNTRDVDGAWSPIEVTFPVPGPPSNGTLPQGVEVEWLRPYLFEVWRNQVAPDAPDDQWTRVNAAPLIAAQKTPDPEFDAADVELTLLDTHVEPGVRYWYRVVAIDVLGRSSVPSKSDDAVPYRFPEHLPWALEAEADLTTAKVCEGTLTRARLHFGLKAGPGADGDLIPTTAMSGTQLLPGSANLYDASPFDRFRVMHALRRTGDELGEAPAATGPDWLQHVGDANWNPAQVVQDIVLAGDNRSAHDPFEAVETLAAGTLVGDVPVEGLEEQRTHVFALYGRIKGSSPARWEDVGVRATLYLPDLTPPCAPEALPIENHFLEASDLQRDQFREKFEESQSPQRWAEVLDEVRAEAQEEFERRLAAWEAAAFEAQTSDLNLTQVVTGIEGLVHPEGGGVFPIAVGDPPAGDAGKGWEPSPGWTEWFLLVGPPSPRGRKAVLRPIHPNLADDRWACADDEDECIEGSLRPVTYQEDDAAPQLLDATRAFEPCTFSGVTRPCDHVEMLHWNGVNQKLTVHWKEIDPGPPPVPLEDDEPAIYARAARANYERTYEQYQPWLLYTLGGVWLRWEAPPDTPDLAAYHACRVRYDAEATCLRGQWCCFHGAPENGLDPGPEHVETCGTCDQETCPGSPCIDVAMRRTVPSPVPQFLIDEGLLAPESPVLSDRRAWENPAVLEAAEAAGMEPAIVPDDTPRLAGGRLEIDQILTQSGQPADEATVEDPLIPEIYDVMGGGRDDLFKWFVWGSDGHGNVGERAEFPRPTDSVPPEKKWFKGSDFLPPAPPELSQPEAFRCKADAEDPCALPGIGDALCVRVSWDRLPEAPDPEHPTRVQIQRIFHHEQGESPAPTHCLPAGKTCAPQDPIEVQYQGALPVSGTGEGSYCDVGPFDPRRIFTYVVQAIPAPATERPPGSPSQSRSVQLPNRPCDQDEVTPTLTANYVKGAVQLGAALEHDFVSDPRLVLTRRSAQPDGSQPSAWMPVGTFEMGDAIPADTRLIPGRRYDYRLGTLQGRVEAGTLRLCPERIVQSVCVPEQAGGSSACPDPTKP